jgi:hypothetical protein
MTIRELHQLASSQKLPLISSNHKRMLQTFVGLLAVVILPIHRRE